jgi:hypothetical protein
LIIGRSCWELGRWNFVRCSCKIEKVISSVDNLDYALDSDRTVAYFATEIYRKFDQKTLTPRGPCRCHGGAKEEVDPSLFRVA